MDTSNRTRKLQLTISWLSIILIIQKTLLDISPYFFIFNLIITFIYVSACVFTIKYLYEAEKKYYWKYTLAQIIAIILFLGLSCKPLINI